MEFDSLVTESDPYMYLVEYKLRKIKQIPSITKISLEAIVFYISVLKNHEKNLSAQAD
jgi:hypothetical protein